MLSFRSKLALGFGGLLLVAALLGVYSLMLLGRLGPAIDMILRENYRSVLAMQEVTESLERMDSGALYALLGRDQAGRRLREEYAPRFRGALAVELHTITLPGEGVRARRLRTLYREYEETLAAVLDTTRSHAERREIYFNTLRPLFSQIKGEADAILRMNQENMEEASQAAREAARTARRRMLLLLLIGAGLAVGFTFFVSRSILRRVRHVTESTDEIRKGNLDVVVPETGRDELSRLAKTFNAMTAHLREIRRTDRARLLRVQHATQLALDQLPDAVALLSTDGEVELSNDAAQRLFDLTPGAMPDQPRLREQLRQPSQTEMSPPNEKPHLDEAMQVFDDGEERFFLPRALPIHDEDRFLAGRLLICSDVTYLRRAYEMNAGLLHRIAHEINSPLTSLRMALHLLLEEKTGVLKPKQMELLLSARDDADWLNRLSRDLLYLHHTSSGEDALATEPVCPTELVKSVLQRLKPAFRERNVLLHADVPSHIPKVQVEPQRIKQVLQVLLESALAHTGPGGDVHMAAQPLSNQRIRVAVSATGNRIPNEQAAHVFDPSHHGDETQCMGFSLSVAQDIVEAHGGRITIENGMSRGTTFAFTLPRAK